MTTQTGRHRHHVVVDTEVDETPLKMEQRFLRVSVVLVLILRVLVVLTCQLVLQFHRDKGNPIEEHHHVKGISVPLGIMKLTNHPESVLLIQDLMVLVHGGFGLEIDQIKRTPPRINSASQRIYDSPLTDGPVNRFQDVGVR